MDHVRVAFCPGPSSVAGNAGVHPRRLPDGRRPRASRLGNESHHTGQAPHPAPGARLPFRHLAADADHERDCDGKPAEILERESLRSNLIRNSANQMFLLVAPEPLAPGREYEVVFQHEGELIEDAGNQVYLVTSRGSWYPSAGVQFTTFDLTFRYPANLQCVAVGEILSDQTEGEVRTTRRRTPSPIRIAGFNLGNYQKTAVTRSGITVEVYANHSVERALQSLARPPLPVAPSGAAAESGTETGRDHSHSRVRAAADKPQGAAADAGRGH